MSRRLSWQLDSEALRESDHLCISALWTDVAVEQPCLTCTYMYSYVLALPFDAHTKGQNRDYFKGFPHVVVIAPVAKEHKERSTVNSLLCCDTGDTWVAWGESVFGNYAQQPRQAHSEHRPAQQWRAPAVAGQQCILCVYVCANVVWLCEMFFFNSSGAICNNREMHFIRRTGSQTGKWYAAPPSPPPKKLGLLGCVKQKKRR